MYVYLKIHDHKYIVIEHMIDRNAYNCGKRFARRNCELFYHYIHRPCIHALTKDKLLLLPLIENAVRRSRTIESKFYLSIFHGILYTWIMILFRISFSCFIMYRHADKNFKTFYVSRSIADRHSYDEN